MAAPRQQQQVGPHAGQPGITRQGGVAPELIHQQQAFGRPLARFDRRIDVHISSIRQKLGPRGDGLSWIESVRGLGYQLLKD